MLHLNRRPQVVVVPEPGVAVWLYVELCGSMKAIPSYCFSLPFSDELIHKPEGPKYFYKHRLTSAYHLAELPRLIAKF